VTANILMAAGDMLGKLNDALDRGSDTSNLCLSDVSPKKGSVKLGSSNNSRLDPKTFHMICRCVSEEYSVPDLVSSIGSCFVRNA
jgi:hypothetical protein